MQKDLFTEDGRIYHSQKQSFTCYEFYKRQLILYPMKIFSYPWSNTNRAWSEISLLRCKASHLRKEISHIENNNQTNALKWDDILQFS